MTGDRPLLLLLAALATLMFATLIMCWTLGGPGAAAGNVVGWDAWAAASDAERRELVAVFNEAQRRDDARAVLNGARQFASVEPERQARLRQIQAALAKFYAELPAAQQRSIRALPPEGRAAQLYHSMESRAPQALRLLLGRQAENH